MPLVSLEERSAAFGLATTLEERLAREVLSLFRLSLSVTLVAFLALAGLDAYFIGTNAIEPRERLVTETVVQSMIAATVVQLGAAMAAIIYAVFRTERRGGMTSSVALISGTPPPTPGL